MPKREGFKKPKFILCEGYEDASFTRALIKKVSLPPFDVSPNIDMPLASGGGAGFGAAIMACEPLEGFAEVENVVILSDNDDDPESSFAAVRKQIEAARRAGDISRNWGAPTQVATKAAGDPSVSIWMWPAPGQPGCLETLLWQGLQTQSKYATEIACVEAACACAGADQWSISKLDKARLRCFLALVYKRNPAIGLGNLFQDSKQPIPLANRVFKPFADFLRAI
jgi:hypothetical protein